MVNGRCTQDLVNLHHYPITDLGGRAGSALIERCRAELAAEGAANLDGFLRPSATLELIREAEALLPQAFVKRQQRNVYVRPVDESWPHDHPGRQLMANNTAQIAYDQIPNDSGIRALFLWDPLTEFIAAALSKRKLYRFADPFQALNLIYLREGEGSHPWHFDHNDSTVTLLLQAPEAGGEFEYVPFIRSREDENFDGVRRLLDGDRTGVRSPTRSSGTLTIFRGEFSAHRVAPVRGQRARITAIMTYDEQPDRESTDEANALVYGARAAKIIAERRLRQPVAG